MVIGFVPTASVVDELAAGVLSAIDELSAAEELSTDELTTSDELSTDELTASDELAGAATLSTTLDASATPEGASDGDWQPARVAAKSSVIMTRIKLYFILYLLRSLSLYS